ncbi:MAG: inositol monophosphatase [Chloroflexi bacterium]|nr:inositol monophosphatase [Chloroflexota bacterium]MDA1240024.1 inositol monophosphatase [Chloroflexota bacterium]
MTQGASSYGLPETPPDGALIEAIEALAVEIAREAGAEVERALRREIAIDYKPDAKGKPAEVDPVSEVDRAVEALVRARLAGHYPAHAIIGEEVEAQPDVDAEWAWVIDPVDGTANFVNGFPMFAVSIGVLHRGRPVAGAIWCAASHTLHPGVYHAHEGGPLRLDGVEVTSERAQVKRRLAAAPGGSSAGTKGWDHRVTGSMAVEAAYVAAGVFTCVPFWSPRLWDIAAGVVLVRAAGREAWIRIDGQWRPLERFEAPARLPKRRDGVVETRVPTLRDWRSSVIIGTAEGCESLRARPARRSWRGRIARRLRRSRR